MRRRWLWIVLGFVVLLCAVALSAGPLVRHRIATMAEARGVELEVDKVRIGPGHVWLHGVQLRSDKAPAIAARLTTLRVDLSWTLQPKAVSVMGADVHIDAPVGELRRQLQQLRGRHAQNDEASSQRLALRANGIGIVWRNALSPGDEQRAWGVGFVRDGDAERLSYDLLRVDTRIGKLEAANGTLTLRRQAKGRVLQDLAASEVTATIALSKQATRNLLPRAAQSAPRAAPAVPASGSKVRKILGEFAKTVESWLVPSGKVELDGLRLQLTHQGEALNIGPARLSVARNEADVELRFVPGQGATRETLALSFRVPLGGGAVALHVAGGPVSLQRLGVQEGDMGLTHVERTRVKLDANAELSADGKRLAFDAKGELRNLAIHQPKLSRQPLVGIEIGLNAVGELDVAKRTLKLTESQFTVGKVHVQVSGSAQSDKDVLQLALHAKVPLVACQDMFDSVPPGLLPLLRGTALTGTFAFDGQVHFDAASPRDIDLSWSVDNHCRISQVPPALLPEPLRDSFSYVVYDGEENAFERRAGPAEPDWVMLDNVSPHMETALLVCEDSRFLTHSGFDEKAIRESIRDNLSAGRFVRGASTLSMQLAKNLYLGREKTLARKFQEAILTMLLEQELSKEEIVELYLNVVEFGPGIFGIRAAAEHYFKTHPAGLSLGQSLYLASILPNPSQQHFDAEGRVTEHWSNYLRKLMRIAHKIGRVSDEELEFGLAEQVVFGVSYEPADVLPASLEAPDEERYPGLAPQRRLPLGSR